MDDVKKKVLLDLFVSPWTLVPIVGGLSAFLLSWGIDGSTALNLAGLAGVLSGVGIQVSRLIYGIEDLTARAHDYQTEQQRRDRDKRLDKLQLELQQDEDPRGEECLRRLRMLYSSLEADPPTGATGYAFREKVDKLFNAAVKQLERSLELLRKARRLPGQTGRPLLAERKKAIDEVVLSVNHLARTVEQYQEFQMKDSDDELAKLRDELDQTIEVARRADEAMDGIDGSRIDEPNAYDQPTPERQ